MATFTVNTSNDIVNPNDGVLSLREAIAAATNSSDRDTIVGSPDFMVYNVTNNTFTVMYFYSDYILDLPGVKIESCTQIEGKIFLGLRIVGEGIVCPHCQNHIEQLHQNRPILVRDLPVFGRPVYLKIPRR